MIRALYRHHSGTLVLDLPQEQLPAAARDSRASLWIDMQDPTAEEYKLVLEDLYHFHPLAIEDTITDNHVPKIDDYGSYLFLVIHAVYAEERVVDLISDELDVFLGANVLITIHKRPMQSIERLWQEDIHQEGGLARGCALLFYTLLDLQIDRIVRLIDRFEAELERLGDSIFLKPDNSSDVQILDQILTAQSSVLRLHRVLLPQRDLMHRLAQAEYRVVPTATRVYFMDVYDHLARLARTVDGMRELARSTVEVYVALSNLRMNEIMKVLTIISTIFIPLGFLAAVYGMNFDFMPELERPWAYPLLWAIFIGIAAGMLRLFRRWHWI